MIVMVDRVQVAERRWMKGMDEDEAETEVEAELQLIDK